MGIKGNGFLSVIYYRLFKSTLKNSRLQKKDDKEKQQLNSFQIKTAVIRW